MPSIDPLVKDFFAQKKIVIVGVSDKRETGCNAVYHRFKHAGYAVSAINPHLTTFHGAPCYPDLNAVPEKPDAVFILASPKVTEEIVQQCVELGIHRVWMHCLMGVKPGLSPTATSVSQDAVQMCHANGITVIPGSCPNQYLNPDFGHRMMRVLFGAFGYLKLGDGAGAKRA